MDRMGLLTTEEHDAIAGDDTQGVVDWDCP